MVNSCLAFQKCVAQMLCYREKIVSVFMKFKKVHWTSTFKAHCLLRVRKNRFHCFFFVIFKYNSIHEFARKCLYNSKVIFKNVSHTIRVKWLADWLILLKKCEKENRRKNLPPTAHAQTWKNIWNNTSMPDEPHWNILKKFSGEIKLNIFLHFWGKFSR